MRCYPEPNKSRLLVFYYCKSGVFFRKPMTPAEWETQKSCVFSSFFSCKSWKLWLNPRANPGYLLREEKWQPLSEKTDRLANFQQTDQ